MNDCNLECAKEQRGEGVLEFIGPVKIVMVDTPQGPYFAKVFKAGAVLMAQVLIGVTIVPALYFSILYSPEDILKGLHILLCTVGIQVFMPFGILTLNPLSGPSSTMRVPHRRAEHMFLQLLGCFCLLAGSWSTYMANYTSFFSVHSCIGIAVVLVTVGTIIFGIGFSCFNCFVSIGSLPGILKCVYYTHRAFGTVTLILSSACFVTGLLRPSVINWILYDDVLYLDSMNPVEGSILKPKTKRIKPLRILIIEPNDSYINSVCYSVAIGISQLMIGATVMAVLVYSIVNGDVHAALCAFAYHLFAVEAILSLNFANGWSSPMMLRHRVFSHVFLQTIAVISGITGTVIIIADKGFSVTAHGLSDHIVFIYRMLNLRVLRLINMEVITEETPLLSASAGYDNLNYTWKLLRGSLNTLVHCLTAVNVFVILSFAFKTYPFSAFQLHVGLSVIGYQLLMSHGILALANYNGWSATLTEPLGSAASRLVISHSRLCHNDVAKGEELYIDTWEIGVVREQTLRAGFTSFYYNTALSGLIFTGVSLINGLLTLYKVGARRILSAKVIKISHLVLGMAAYSLSSVCLVYGFLKKPFIEWSSIWNSRI